MKAYVLTEDQMRAYWALERATRSSVPEILGTYLALLQKANAEAEDQPTEGTAAIAAERLTHPGRGWTAEHDSGHASDLIAAAVSYAFAADGCVTTGHPLYRPGLEPPLPWPWGAHYWKPADDAVRNLEKAGALLAAALDTIEAS